MESIAKAKSLPNKGRTYDSQRPWNRDSPFSFAAWWSTPSTRYLKVDQPSGRDEHDSLDLEDEDVSKYLASHRERQKRRASCAAKAKVLIIGCAVISLFAIIGALGFALGRRATLPGSCASPAHQNPHTPPHPRPTKGEAHDAGHSGSHSSSSSTNNHHHSHDDSPPPPHVGIDKPKQCGESPDEAQSRGCIFEPQLTAWVAPECAFPAVVAEYQDAVGDMMTEWPWFWDTGLQKAVSPEEFPSLQAGNYSVVYTPYQASHALHCLYCWRKVSYALEHGVDWMDARCHQFYHQRHCAFFIADKLLEMEDWRAAAEVDVQGRLTTWTYPLLYHNCVPLSSTMES
uniref:Phomopsin biosynthesis cluster protein B n=1 Tax=Diaporthe leptostromiformis TaxID=291059 RepID=PHOB1_DIALO|nr:RecName: Full=Phomopsin biosynthesis cluster protein B [Diaporthe leptostromiformis]BDA39146.1 hypothetical protein [Diaporthe leptostromiformis]